MPTRDNNDTTTTLNSRDRRKKQRRERAKRSLDPMTDVKRELSSRVILDRDRKSKHTTKEDRVVSLRERRLKRERFERDRANALVRESSHSYSRNTNTRK